MDEALFKKELEICRQLNKENGGKCKWGECDKCGTIPLLYKLYKSELLEDENQIKDIKKEIFS